MKIPAILANAIPISIDTPAAASENSFNWGGTLSANNANPPESW